MTQNVILTIDGADMTENLVSANVQQSVNTVFDTATIVLDGVDMSGLKAKPLSLEYADATFSGFVYTVSRTGRNTVSITARTKGGYLADPYSVVDESAEPATTSHELMRLYSSESGVDIYIDSEEFAFGNSYARIGTRAQAIGNIAAVTGAEYYYHLDSIWITPNKHVAGNAHTEIDDSEYFDFLAETDTIKNNGVGTVIVGEKSGTSTEVEIKHRLCADIDECTGEIHLYPVPFSHDLDYTYGAVFENTESQKLMTESRILAAESYIELEAAIYSLESVKLDGLDVSGAHFSMGTSLLYFDAALRGNLSVKYRTKYIRGFANIRSTSSGRIIDFDARQGEELIRVVQYLSGDCGNDNSNITNMCGMKIIVDDNLNYVQGFTVYTIDGNPSFSFYDGSSKIERAVISKDEAYTSKEQLTLQPVDGETYYLAQVQYPMLSVVGARSAGMDIPYTTVESGGDYYFRFEQYYPKVVGVYTTNAKKHTVQFDNIPGGEITMVIRNVGCDGMAEYELTGIDSDDQSTIPCGLNQYYPLSLDSLLGLPVQDVANKMIPYTGTVNGTAIDSGSISSDSFGIVYWYADRNADIVFDCGNIKPGYKITLSINVPQQAGEEQ